MSSQSQEDIEQIVAITGCNPAQATQVLSKYDNNVERAINSIFDDPEQFNRPHPPPSTSEANAVVPWTGGNNLNNNSNNAITSNTSTNNAAAASYDPHQEWSKPPGQPPSRPQTHTNTHSQQQSVTFKQPWEDAPPYYQGQGGQSNDIIDLTGGAGDDDEDLQRAMAASLQEQHHSQQPGYYSHSSQPGQDTSVGPLQQHGNNSLSEDEQLRQALEASVQSLPGGLRQEASGSRTPVIPHHLEVGEHSKRKPGAPVALVAPFASIEIAAAMLQAFASLTQVRHAFLAFQPADERAADLVNYWKGVSPPEADGGSLSGMDPSRKISIDICRRVQTLFAFMNETERGACIVRDVTSLTPANIVALGAENANPVRLASLYYEFLTEAFLQASHLHATLAIPATEDIGIDLEEARRNFINERSSIFQSWGASALNAPPTPVDGQEPGSVPAPQSIPVAKTYLGLVHDSVNRDVYSCLRSALAADGEAALMTDAAQVLCLSVVHRTDESLERFSVDETLYVDPFMWDKRGGVRLDSEMQTGAVAGLNESLRELEARKRKLNGDGGKDTKTLLQASIQYFEELAISPDDEVRAAVQKEAGPQLRNVVAELEAELESTDEAIASITTRVRGMRAEARERAKEEALKPEWRTMEYRLQAVLVHEARRIYAYTRQADGRWWRICDGAATEVTLDEVQGDKIQDRDSSGVFWICYAKVDADAASQDEPCPETTKAGIAEDNLTFQSELLSLVRSDAASRATSDRAEMDQGIDAGTDTDAVAASQDRGTLADEEDNGGAA